MDLIYLASPYSHPLHEVRQYRYELVLEATINLMRRGYVIYSPIVHNHYINISEGWEFWKNVDEVMLERCDQLWVLTIDGWDRSVGVKSEMEKANEFNLRVAYVKFSESENDVSISSDVQDFVLH